MGEGVILCLRRLTPRFVADIRLTNKVYDGRRWASGPTVHDKEFNLGEWDYAESHDCATIAYLTTGAGQKEPAKNAKPTTETVRSHSY